MGDSGQQQVLADLGTLAERAKDLTGVWPHVGEVFKARQEAIFSKGGRPKWPPLAARTILAHGPNQGPLIRTGLMMLALTADKPVESSRSHAVFGAVRGSREAKLGVLHRSGTKTMPVRNPLPPFTPTERKKVVEVMREQLMKGIGH